ncbi:MAG: response regulator [Burkholderiales bacterium]|nr:response regulator [Burkholderiales bacterium]
MLTSVGSLRMLIVDDDDVDRERVRRFLTKSTQIVDVVEAESGFQALQLLQDDQFDCIVLDNHLGDTTGAELISRIQQESRYGCPIIMVTGAGNENLAVQAMMDGAYDYLPKTQLSSDVLLRSVKRAVELHRARRELAQIHESLEQRVDEQAATIRQSAKDLRALVDSAPTAMGYWDMQQRCRFGNVCLGQWFQVSSAELPGMHLRDLLGQALYEDVRPHLEQALEGHAQAFERPLRLANASSGPKCLYWQLRPDLGGDGQCLGFYATLSDITASRLVQERVEELLHFSDAVIDNSPIGIAVFQADGVCVLSNQAFVETCGEHENWTRSSLWPAIQSTLDGGLPCRVEVSWPQATDAPQAQLACSFARFDRAGSHHVLVIARDVTEQIQAHEALVSARDSAESAARAKSAFLANMSHEIRTPMNAIVGFSRLALEDELPHTARAYIEKMHTSALALMDILDDVLDYSKIEAGFMHLEHTHFVLEETLQRVADLFQARIEQKNLSFVVDLAPNVPQDLVGDPLRLSQVLTNLVGNAIKFTDHGYIQLRVHVASPKQAADGTLSLSFNVADTGVGVAPEIQAGLFEAFIQGDSSITRRFGGTGLGLAICKRLVNLMGGQIGVKSTQGKGSEFWFTMQVKVAGDGTQPDRSNGVAGRRVLVLDANALARKAVARQLRSWHVASHGGGDIASGLAHIERLQRKGLAVDTLLVDYALVRSGGAAGLEQLHERAAHALGDQPAMIFVTTQGDRLDALSAHVPGDLRSVLVKPVLASRLLEVLHGGTAARPSNGYGGLDAAASHDARLQSEKLRAMAAPLQGRKILLVEDNELNQIVASEFLRRCGMQVTIVGDGVQAVAAVQAAGGSGLDAVLMDMHMPVMDGLEATRRITAAVLPEDKMRCREAGMVDHIAKPVIPEQVISVLLKWVAKQLAHNGGDVELPSLPQASLPAAGPGIDLAALRERVHGSQELVIRLLTVFAEQEVNAASAVCNLIACGDSVGAQRKAHDLKGSSANLGLMAFAKTCAILQAALQQEEGVSAALADFVQAHAQCLSEIKHVLADARN